MHFIGKITSIAMALTTMSYVGVSAAPLGNLSNKDAVAQTVSEASPQVLQVQYRYYRHYGPAGPQAWHYGRPYPGHGHRDDAGAAIALGIFGMMLGGMLAAEAQRQEAINYCAQRFRSFDPQSMTYLGFEGFGIPVLRPCDVLP